MPKTTKRFYCRNIYDRDTLTLDNDDHINLVDLYTPKLKEKQPCAVEAKEYMKNTAMAKIYGYLRSWR
jgi:endonuclease YncB( thermonuclease family)